MRWARAGYAPHASCDSLPSWSFRVFVPPPCAVHIKHQCPKAPKWVMDKRQKREERKRQREERKEKRPKRRKKPRVDKKPTVSALPVAIAAAAPEAAVAATALPRPAASVQAIPVRPADSGKGVLQRGQQAALSAVATVTARPAPPGAVAHDARAQALRHCRGPPSAASGAVQAVAAVGIASLAAATAKDAGMLAANGAAEVDRGDRLGRRQMPATPVS